MKKPGCYCLVLLCLLFTQASAQQATEFPDNIQVVIDGHGLPASSFSMLVQEIGSDTPILAHNSDTALIPASSIKTLTTLAALEVLGPAYTWQTEIYALGPVTNDVLNGDLLIKGSGDPFLLEDQLRNMLKALQRRGIKYISGDLILDGSFFDPTVENGMTIDNQGGRAYNTEPNAVTTNFHAVTFYFRPHPNGRDVIINSDPQLPNLTITNRLRLANRSCGGFQRGVSFNVNPNDPSDIIFEGAFPNRCDEYQMVREVLDAQGFTFGLFKQLWQELGGQLEGSMRTGVAPEEMEPILVWRSPPMSDVIKSINKFSNNLMTRHLLLTLGAETMEPPATVEKGQDAVSAYLKSRGLDSSQVHLSNGSGLSRDTRITTDLLNGILRSGWISPYMPEYVASLPINGIDGTMRNRLRGSNLSGRMHVKTGSLDEVAAVAGYVYSGNGKIFTVSGIINHELADRGPGSELMDALLLWTYRQ